MGHHVDRIDLAAGCRLRHRLHHLIGHPLGAVRPDVDHLVVLLALGDQAVEVLLLVLLHLLLGGGDELLLGGRDDQVILAEGDAGAAGMGEAQRHQPVAEDHRLLLTAVTVDLIDHAGDFPLRHELVHDVEGNLG